MKRLSYFFNRPPVIYSDCSLHITIKTSTYSAQSHTHTRLIAELLAVEKQEAGPPQHLLTLWGQRSCAAGRASLWGLLYLVQCIQHQGGGTFNAHPSPLLLYRAVVSWCHDSYMENWMRSELNEVWTEWENGGKCYLYERPYIIFFIIILFFPRNQRIHSIRLIVKWMLALEVKTK